MREIELEAGTIEYEDRGEGPVLVLIGGLAMDWRLWEEVIALLGPGYRCIAPNMPLGSHRTPMNPDADLSLVGMGRIIADLLERLDLRDATLVFNDWAARRRWSPTTSSTASDDLCSSPAKPSRTIRRGSPAKRPGSSRSYPGAFR